jgi:hypothetical protein
MDITTYCDNISLSTMSITESQFKSAELKLYNSHLPAKYLFRQTESNNETTPSLLISP